MDSERDRALAEIAYCESILAKGGLTVLSDLFRGVSDIAAWDHYPPGDVFDPVSGSQWYYHCHPAGECSSEHGHFHCFIRPTGAEGSIHHLVAIGVDQNGKILRLFTVNQWVVGDDWADAATIIGLIDRFDMAMPRPSYLVNRWLTAVLIAYKTEIEGLLNERDRVLAAHPNADVHKDRSLEVTSSFSV